MGTPIILFCALWHHMTEADDLCFEADWLDSRASEKSR